MLLTEKPLRRWIIEPVPDESAVRRLSEALGLPTLVAGLLARNGRDDPEAARAFLEPRLSALHDPARLPGCVAAARRILTAVAEKQTIVVYGDYDVDGVTASAILWHMLTALGAVVENYIPHRLDEGYGLNSEAIEQLASRNPKPLVITVDCGITALAQAALARERGLELIITDHHAFPDRGLPEASILVHPRLAGMDGDSYPFGQLCGAGVALKLAWQIAREHCGSERVSNALRDLLMDSLSLAALGSVADVVPLEDENRLLVRFGLAQIKRTRFGGLNALIEASNLARESIDSYHVGFVLGPRLNACGRMGHARDALKLLTDATASEARQLAEMLNQVNQERRGVERGIFKDAEARVIEAGFDSPDRRAIVLAGEGWHGGVIGIVASRLVDRFNRPVVMLNVENGLAQGSARSVLGVSILDAISEASHLLMSFGGHDMAAGLKVEARHIDELRRIVIEHINRRLSERDLVPTMKIDAQCRLDELDLQAVRHLSRLEPFGRGNDRPRFLIRDCLVNRAGERMGRDGRHLSIHLRQGGTYQRAIGWNLGDWAAQLPAGARLDVVCEARVNRWNDRESVDLEIKDFRPAGVEEVAADA
ncbi:MAG: single-stranded-DNA-specific exonuclease RecJ [Phycisphaeraceae bacterium]|nr:single-stranded-DNA-specific exonuclease RecJ [Phycisphaeraceae bacterium]